MLKIFQVCTKRLYSAKRKQQKRNPGIISGSHNRFKPKGNSSISNFNKQVNLKQMVERFTMSKQIREKLKSLELEEDLIIARMHEYRDLMNRGIGHDELNIAQLKIRNNNKEDIERVLLNNFLNYVKHNSPQNALSTSLDSLMSFSDMSAPTDWYSETRNMKRRIILHVGPTNSGKTYHALQALTKASSGIYCGPLRLLAHEIYENMNNSGVPCNLITGEDRRESPGVMINSCTVEMAPLNMDFDVAVVDEIQMISDPSRGWAWTQAILGLKAKELHICGEPTAVELLQKLFKSTNEEVEVKTYKRLTPLQVQDKSLKGNLKKIQKGDCLITFSRNDIFVLKKKIEEMGYSCAVIYGGLPPETRSEQAKLFNDANSKYDVLVASDAVGMGLNLNIKRIIFERVEKFDGFQVSLLSISHLKQIAGRAGRFSSDHGLGLVNALDEDDLKYVQATMPKTPHNITHAGIGPFYDMLEKFSKILPDHSLSLLLDKFQDLAKTGGDYFLCNLETQKSIATVIEKVPNLTLHDRYQFMVSPANTRNPLTEESILQFAKCVSQGKVCHISDIVELSPIPPKNSEQLKDAENIHKITMLYLWLSYRFPDTFIDVATALVLKQKCEQYINHALNNLNIRRTTKFLKKKRKDITENSDPDVLIQEFEQTKEIINERREELEKMEKSPVEKEVDEALEEKNRKALSDIQY